MKFLKHILFLLLAFLGLFQTKLEAKLIVLENGQTVVFAEEDFKEVSTEKEWLGLLHLQKESANQFSFSHFLSGSLFQNSSGELCLKNRQSSHQSNFPTRINSTSHLENGGWNEDVFHGNPRLVDSWRVLSDAGETNLASRIDDIEFVDDYLKTSGKSADDLTSEIKNAGDISTWKTNLAGEFTLKQVDDYVAFATKQNDKTKIMLGMWDGGGPSSYITKAGNDYTYFDFGDKWDEAYNLVNKSDDEIWRINKKFIDNQKAAGKEFWFSHNPFSPKNEQFFAREVNYLIDELDVKDFEKIGDLWKAVW